LSPSQSHTSGTQVRLAPGPHGNVLNPHDPDAEPAAMFRHIELYSPAVDN